MKILSCTMLCFIFLTAVSVQAADFSGKWKLSKAKSSLNDQFSMAPSEVIIVQNGNEFSIEKHSSYQGNDYTSNDKYTLDGKECINEGFQGSKKKSTAVWDEGKNVLTVKSTLPMQDGGEIAITEVYKTSEKDLVISSHASSSWGDLDETMVYEKQ